MPSARSSPTTTGSSEMRTPRYGRPGDATGRGGSGKSPGRTCYRGPGSLAYYEDDFPERPLSVAADMEPFRRWSCEGSTGDGVEKWTSREAAHSLLTQPKWSAATS